MEVLAIDIVGSKNHPEIQDSPRRRELGNWSVVTWKARLDDQDIEVHYLYGVTVTEADGKPPGDDFVRFTSTSPIVSCEKNVVTTASGSKYTLLQPSRGVTLSLENDPVIPERLWNSWIQGSNWTRATARRSEKPPTLMAEPSFKAAE